MTRGDARGSAPDLATAAADDEAVASPRRSPTRGGALTADELRAAGVVVPELDEPEAPPSSAPRPRDEAEPARRKRPVVATGPVPTRMGTGSWDDLVEEAQRLSTGDASEPASPTRSGTLGWGTRPTARRAGSSRTMAAVGPIRGGTQKLDLSGASAEDARAAAQPSELPPGEERPSARGADEGRPNTLDLDLEGLGDSDVD